MGHFLKGIFLFLREPSQGLRHHHATSKQGAGDVRGGSDACRAAADITSANRK